jgi:hypothetical protein
MTSSDTATPSLEKSVSADVQSGSVQHGVVEENIYQRKSSDALNAAVFEVS